MIYKRQEKLPEKENEKEKEDEAVALVFLAENDSMTG